MLLALMQTGPPGLHVYSRLTTSPSSVDGTVYRRLHSLPIVHVGLSVPDLGAWLEVPSSHMHTYTIASIIASIYTVTSIITSTKRQQ
jgi:hypothetical protein